MVGGWVQYSQCHLRQLLLGEVERVIVGTDAERFGVFTSLQACPQDPVVHHVEERADTVPAFVVEPNLKGEMTILDSQVQSDNISFSFMARPALYLIRSILSNFLACFSFFFSFRCFQHW